MIVTGTVVAGTRVARQSCRNTQDHDQHQHAASISVWYTSWIDAFTNRVVSNGMPQRSPAGKLLRQLLPSWPALRSRRASAFASGVWKIADAGRRLAVHRNFWP